MSEIKLVTELLKMVKQNEWQIRHAGENAYCPYCCDDIWVDQTKHNPGCHYVKMVAEAEKYLKYLRMVGLR